MSQFKSRSFFPRRKKRVTSKSSFPLLSLFLAITFRVDSLSLSLSFLLKKVLGGLRLRVGFTITFMLHKKGTDMTWTGERITEKKMKEEKGEVEKYRPKQLSSSP